MFALMPRQLQELLMSGPDTGKTVLMTAIGSKLQPRFERVLDSVQRACNKAQVCHICFDGFGERLVVATHHKRQVGSGKNALGRRRSAPRLSSGHGADI